MKHALDISIMGLDVFKRQFYTTSQKHESTLLHTYVLNNFLTADH